MQQQRSPDRIKAELARESKYRDKSKAEGLLRPFLLLVAMPPIFRNQVASNLGWTIFTQKYFGDPHAEAWDILSSTYTGMQSRCNKSYEKVNPFASSCNWYDMLVRVGKAGFNVDLSQKIPWKETSEKCNDSSDAFVKDIEESFLLEISRVVASQMSEEQRQAFTEELESERAKRIQKLFVNNAGVKKGEVIQYGYKITNQVTVASRLSHLKILKLDSSLKAAVFAESTKLVATISPTAYASIVAPLTAQLTLLSTPLFFLGILGLTQAGVLMVLGSSEGRLFNPVVMMLNQRLLLALEGIKIEDFY